MPAESSPPPSPSGGPSPRRPSYRSPWKSSRPATMEDRFFSTLPQTDERRGYTNRPVLSRGRTEESRSVRSPTQRGQSEDAGGYRYDNSEFWNDEQPGTYKHSRSKLSKTIDNVTSREIQFETKCHFEDVKTNLKTQNIRDGIPQLYVGTDYRRGEKTREYGIENRGRSMDRYSRDKDRRKYCYMRGRSEESHIESRKVYRDGMFRPDSIERVGSGDEHMMDSRDLVYPSSPGGFRVRSNSLSPQMEVSSPPYSPPTHASYPFTKVKESARVNSVFVRPKDTDPFVVVSELDGNQKPTGTHRVSPYFPRGFKGHPPRAIKSAPTARKPKAKPIQITWQPNPKRRIPRLCNKFGRCLHETPTRSLAGIVPEGSLKKKRNQPQSEEVEEQTTAESQLQTKAYPQDALWHTTAGIVRATTKPHRIEEPSQDETFKKKNGFPFTAFQAKKFLNSRRKSKEEDAALDTKNSAGMTGIKAYERMTHPKTQLKRFSTLARLSRAFGLRRNGKATEEERRSIGSHREIVRPPSTSTRFAAVAGITNMAIRSPRPPSSKPGAGGGSHGSSAGGSGREGRGGRDSSSVPGSRRLSTLVGISTGFGGSRTPGPAPPVPGLRSARTLNRKLRAAGRIVGLGLGQQILVEEEPGGGELQISSRPLEAIVRLKAGAGGGGGAWAAGTHGVRSRGHEEAVKDLPPALGGGPTPEVMREVVAKAALKRLLMELTGELRPEWIVQEEIATAEEEYVVCCCCTRPIPSASQYSTDRILRSKSLERMETIGSQTKEREKEKVKQILSKKNKCCLCCCFRVESHENMKTSQKLSEVQLLPGKLKAKGEQWAHKTKIQEAADEYVPPKKRKKHCFWCCTKTEDSTEEMIVKMSQLQLPVEKFNSGSKEHLGKTRKSPLNTTKLKSQESKQSELDCNRKCKVCWLICCCGCTCSNKPHMKSMAIQAMSPSIHRKTEKRKNKWTCCGGTKKRKTESQETLTSNLQSPEILPVSARKRHKSIGERLCGWRGKNWRGKVPLRSSNRQQGAGKQEGDGKDGDKRKGCLAWIKRRRTKTKKNPPPPAAAAALGRGKEARQRRNLKALLCCAKAAEVPRASQEQTRPPAASQPKQSLYRRLFCSCCKKPTGVDGGGGVQRGRRERGLGAAPGTNTIPPLRPLTRPNLWKRIFCCQCKKAGGPELGSRKSHISKRAGVDMASRASSLTSFPKLEATLVEHTSMMKAAIPVLPICLAWTCLILNVFLPGTGTIISGFLCVCFGKPRFSVKDSTFARFGSLCVNLVIGVGQMFTIIFCFVGWGWSIWWGVIMLRLARKYRRIKQAEQSPEDPPTAETLSEPGPGRRG